MENLPHEVLTETNNARTNPNSYIPYLQQMLGQFQGLVLQRPGKINLRTNEGAPAVQECIKYLQNLKPLKPIVWDDNMAKAAADHATDIGSKGITGHTGSNGSTMQSRLEKYGDWMGSIGENIEFGGKSGREIVISLIVDDGVASRGHRTNLFSSNFLKAGVACYSHKQYETCTVIDYATEFSLKEAHGSKPNTATNVSSIGSGGIVNQNKPPNTVETLTSKKIKTVNGKKTITETITYKLSDGSQKITERTYQE